MKPSLWVCKKLGNDFLIHDHQKKEKHVLKNKGCMEWSTIFSCKPTNARMLQMEEWLEQPVRAGGLQCRHHQEYNDSHGSVSDRYNCYN